MKKLMLRSVVTALFLFIPFFCFAIEPGQRTITTTGEATVKAAPDNVVINLSVVTINPDLKVARQKNNSKLGSILELCKKENIKDEDIKTSQITVSPKYKYIEQKYVFEGMSVNQSLSITLRDISKYNDFLDALLGLGTRYIHGVDFKTTELKKHREEARSLALAAAKEKAEKLAAELSQKIGKPLVVNEGFVPDVGFLYGMARSSQVQVESDGSAGSDYTGTGLIDIKATVTTTFELVD